MPKGKPLVKNGHCFIGIVKYDLISKLSRSNKILGSRLVYGFGESSRSPQCGSIVCHLMYVFISLEKGLKVTVDGTSILACQIDRLGTSWKIGELSKKIAIIYVK